MKLIFIAAGGTGGHIYPALALADEIRTRYPECRIVFTGSDSRMEQELIPQYGYEFIGMHMEILKGSPLHKGAAAFSYLESEERTYRLLKKERPDACVGFGNYISIPLITAAERLHIPTMIHEQNSFAGKANVFLSKRCEAVACSYRNSMQQFPANKTRLTGNPAASAAVRRNAGREIIRSYGLDPEVPFVLFMMGSLGSDSVSEIIDRAIPMFADDYQVLIVTGKAVTYRFRNTDGVRVKTVEFVDGAEMLRHADLAVTRAGATTICEITALGTPAILIPSPFVPNNHQVYNARELSDNAAAVMIEENELDAEVLADHVNRLMSDDLNRSELSKKASAMGTPEAASLMADWLEELINHD